MRPGRFRLGSGAATVTTSSRGIWGFNEARAFPPGKWPIGVYDKLVEDELQ